ncbi:unnamed protein product [Miscanthus lutarioriparius]|uniref:Uncharacterized protein n=1 Tax=Miscanthus lutarioriparius TaxID=422564 RepID=A0A811QPR2_9POAL|nr:unnamed protein product [Miscanthus lutarioriparius]
MDTLHPHKDKKRSTRPKSHHEGKHDTTKDIYYTIIDTSIDKWKTKKSIYSDDFGKVSSKNPEETFQQHDSVIKGKRRFSLISKPQENYEKEKEKEATLQGRVADKKSMVASKQEGAYEEEEKEKVTASQGITISSGKGVIEILDDQIQTQKRTRCSQPIPEDNGGTAFHIIAIRRKKISDIITLASC